MTHNRLVAGSSPAGATKFQGLASNRRSFLFCVPSEYLRKSPEEALINNETEICIPEQVMTIGKNWGMSMES